LTYTEDDLNEILTVYDKPDDLILIHAGKGWESKNFPLEWWQEIIDSLSKQGLRVGLIGKNVDDEHGYIPVKCPENGVDFRDKTSIMGMVALIDQAPVLVTNDSSPIFIAGAFDNYLIAIPTCKEGDMILPYRKGEQSYKAVCLGKKIIRDDQPFRVPDMNVWQIRSIPEGHTISEYLPETGEVIGKAIKFFNQAKKRVWLETNKEAVNE
jgi:ADP-heptose:LPS heptosyltransferase